MAQFEVEGSFWSGRRVFVTGHTGFKGAWLVHLLNHLGATVGGYSLPPEGDKTAFAALDIESQCLSAFGDVRDRAALALAIRQFEPEIVLHLAAQAIVLNSYIDPFGTFETNVMGTAALLEACREVPSVKAVVVVTSDKCYRNRNVTHAYNEDDALGAEDPYSASKACAEILSASYTSSFFRNPDSAVVATARAGNVFGGGDWSEFRLVPDAIRAFSGGASLQVRNPDAMRPWQFVLEPLSGYLMLARACYEGGRDFGHAWNFGPPALDARCVKEFVEKVADCWGADSSWQALATMNAPHEDSILLLDSSKAERELSWSPRLDFQTAVSWTVEWYRAQLEGKSTNLMQALTNDQIDRYLSGDVPS